MDLLYRKNRTEIHEFYKKASYRKILSFKGEVCNLVAY